jgi:hypothetical protein
MDPLSPQHGPQVVDGGNCLQLAANTLNKQPWTADKEWSSTFDVGCGSNNQPLAIKNKIAMKIHIELQT